MSTLQGLSWDEAWRLFDYDPCTGVFTRLTPRGGHPVGAAVGTVDGKGYLHVNVRGAFIRLHRLAWFMFLGFAPDGMVDHKNRTRLDNRIANLRLCTQHLNNGNQRGYRHNTSGVRGVYWNKKRGIWACQIKVYGKQTYLGSHHDPRVVGAWYNHKATELFGHFATLNDIPGYGPICLPPGKENLIHDALHPSTLATHHKQSHT